MINPRSSGSTLKAIGVTIVKSAVEQRLTIPNLKNFIIYPSHYLLGFNAEINLNFFPVIGLLTLKDDKKLNSKECGTC